MSTRRVLVAAGMLAVLGLVGPAMAVPVPFSDGSFFFEDFDGPGGTFNPTGGTSINAGATVQVSEAREGDYFNYTLSGSENGEYRGELTSPLPPTQEFVYEVVWTIDEDSYLYENAAVMRSYQITSPDGPTLLHVEAVEAAGDGGPTWDIEISESTTLGLALAKGVQHTIAAHNLGNGDVDLYVDGDPVGTFPSLGPGRTTTWLGNNGNLSVGIGFSSALLHSVSAGNPIPEPGTMALLGLGGLLALVRRRK